MRVPFRLLATGVPLLLVLVLALCAACAPAAPATPATQGAAAQGATTAPTSAPAAPATAAPTQPVAPKTTVPKLDLPVGVDADGNFYRGDPKAPVKLVDFSDFQ